MEIWLWTQIALLIILLTLSAFFSGTEIALFSLSRLQQRRLRQEHPGPGQIVGQLLDQPHRLLSTILMGNTLINIAAAAVGYFILRELWAAHAEWLAVPVMTTLLLLIGEVTPKTW